MTQEALKLALEALKGLKSMYGGNGHKLHEINMIHRKHDTAITALEEALAQPKEEKLHPIHIGVDVTKEGTTVTAFYRKPDAVMEMFYSQFHPMAQPEQEPVACKHEWFRTGAMEPKEHWCIKCGTFNTTPPQPEQEPVAWRNAAIRVGEDLSSVGPDGYYDMTAQQWLDWAIEQEPRGKNSLAQPEQEPMISKWVLREVYFDEDGEPTMHRSTPQRKPLTDEEIEKLADDFLAYQIEDYQVNGVFTFARAIEAAHGIKEKQNEQ